MLSMDAVDAVDEADAFVVVVVGYSIVGSIHLIVSLEMLALDRFN
jgi:hypothetical protein